MRFYMAKIQFWTKEMREFLLANYSYDPVKGEITRAAPPSRGVWTKTALGSITPAGDMVIMLNFGGKLNAIRCGRLAAFLETGKQYAKVGHVDGNRSNIVLENLVFMEEMTEDTLDEHEKSRLELEEQTTKLHLKQRSEAKAKLAMTKLEMSGEKKDEPRPGTYEAENIKWKAENPGQGELSDELARGREEIRKLSSFPAPLKDMYEEHFKKLRIPIWEEWIKQRYLYGMSSYMTQEQCDQFYSEALTALGTTEEELGKRQHDLKEDWPRWQLTLTKWQLDVANIALARYGIGLGLNTEDNLKYATIMYKHGDKNLYNAYGTWPYEWERKWKDACKVLQNQLEAEQRSQLGSDVSPVTT